ncbi:MAG TPA: hypothetical protein V6C91_21255 [Coleofasciculaceae cyanobacterium]
MIEELVAVLNSKLGLTGNEIADILWLALHMELPESEQIDGGSSQVPLDNLKRDTNQSATSTTLSGYCFTRSKKIGNTASGSASY